MYSAGLYAQTPMTLQDCEVAFAQNNLQLLAEQYQIDQAKAQVIQAKIWDLPQISAELNAIDPQNNKFFHVGNTGEKLASINQIIYLGGKKRNEVEVAKTNVEVAQWQFSDLLRNLSFELKSAFYAIYFAQQQLNLTQPQMENLDALLKSYQEQSEKGNVSFKDLARLQSLYFDFKNSRAEIKRELIEKQATLKLLVGTTADINPLIDSVSMRKWERKNTLVLPVLLDSALQNRADYRMAISQNKAAQQYLKWQKSLAVPDLNIGAAYDQRGGAFNNQVDVTVGIPLPLWNQNKGNIAAAKAQLKQSETLQMYQQKALENEIDAVFKKWWQAQENFSNFKSIGTKTLTEVYKGIFQNFKKGNISILEFADFMESYHQSITSYNETFKNYVLATEEVNKSTQSVIF